SAAVGNFTLTVTGKNFVSGAKVVLNSTALNTTFSSSTQLTASGTTSAAGTFSVTVVNPDPGSSSSGAATFTATGGPAPPPPPPPPGGGSTSACSGMAIGQGASLNGFRPFTNSSLWNADISAAPVDANSGAIMSFIGTTKTVHADFGAGQYQ